MFIMMHCIFVSRSIKINVQATSHKKSTLCMRLIMVTIILDDPYSTKCFLSDMPFGQLPALKVDNVTLCQSEAIEFYLAKTFGKISHMVQVSNALQHDQPNSCLTIILWHADI